MQTVKKVRIVFYMAGTYFYKQNEVYEVKPETAVHYIVVSGEHKGKLIAMGHCEDVLD